MSQNDPPRDGPEDFARSSSLGSELQAPTLLVAMPQVLDPYFHHSVVLLLSHGEDGSLGFIVNRPTTIRIAEILQGMNVGWHGPRDALAYFGGPVQPQLGSVLCGGALGEMPEDHQGMEVGKDLLITQHIGDLESLAAEPPENFRLFLGYAGWGEEQLEAEILRNDWLTVPVLPELIFAADTATVWEEAMRSVGVDPSSLSWAAASGSQSAN